MLDHMVIGCLTFRRTATVSHSFPSSGHSPLSTLICCPSTSWAAPSPSPPPPSVLYRPGSLFFSLCQNTHTSGPGESSWPGFTWPSCDLGGSLLSALPLPLNHSNPIPGSWTTSTHLLSPSPLPAKFLCVSVFHPPMDINMSGQPLGLGWTPIPLVHLASLTRGRSGKPARAGGGWQLGHRLSQLPSAGTPREGAAGGFAGELVPFCQHFLARQGKSWPNGGLSRHLTKHCTLALTPQRGSLDLGETWGMGSWLRPRDKISQESPLCRWAYCMQI